MCPGFHQQGSVAWHSMEVQRWKSCPPGTHSRIGVLSPSCSLDSPWAGFKSFYAWAICQLFFKTPQMIPMCSQDEDNWSTRSWHTHKSTDPVRDNRYSIMTIPCFVSSNGFLALNGSSAYGSLCTDVMRIEGYTFKTINSKQLLMFILKLIENRFFIL